MRQIRRIYAHCFNPGLARMFALAGCPREVRARGALIFDEHDRDYLDFGTSFGVFPLGHAHAEVRDAFLGQLDELACTLYDSDPRRRLGSRLAEKLPGDLNRVYFAGSGSEAIEIALRTVELAQPSRRRIVTSALGYHGKTLGALGVIGQAHLRAPFAPLWTDVRYVPFGDARALREAVGDGVAAVILEPVLAGNDLVVPPDGYLAAAREICDETDSLLVIDEVQTGFGRTGRMFGVDHDGVTPDIIVVFKTLTGGYAPVAATVISDALAARAHLDDSQLERAFASDSGGWPIVCAVANATLDVIERDRLEERAARMGKILLSGLRGVAAEHPRLVVEASGRGLMTGIRLRGRAIEYLLWLHLLDRRILSGLSLNTSTRAPVLRFYPPFTVDQADIDRFLPALRDSLKTIDRLPSWLLGTADAFVAHQAYVPRPLLRGAKWVLT